MLDIDHVRAGYDRIAAEYAEIRDCDSSLPFLQRLDSALAPGSLVLDLGCGAGVPVDRWLVGRGHRVIGLDISDAMLDLARRNVPKADYRRRDMVTLDDGEFSVDAVVSYFALFHIDRRQHHALFRRIRSYLPNGGLLLVTTGGSDWEGEEDFLGARMLWSHFDRAANRQLIAGSGFRILFEGLHAGNAFVDEMTRHPVFLARAV